MSKNAKIKALIKHIHLKLPDAAESVNELMRSRAYDQEEIESMTYRWVETFADITNNAIREKNADRVKTQTELMAQQFLTGGRAVKNIVDVSYVENLMWDVSAAEKAWAWPLLPKTVHNLYIRMWGVPRF